MKTLASQLQVVQSLMLKITGTSQSLICYQSRHLANGLKSFVPRFQKILPFAGLDWLQTGV
jgi:hypothetical protein